MKEALESGGKNTVKLVFSVDDAETDAYEVVTSSEFNNGHDSVTPSDVESDDESVIDAPRSPPIVDVAPQINNDNTLTAPNSNAGTITSTSVATETDGPTSVDLPIAASTQTETVNPKAVDHINLTTETEASHSPDAPVKSNVSQTFGEFADEVQPLIDQLLTKLESRPAYIAPLLARFSSTLEARNWGLTIETETGSVLASTSSANRSQSHTRRTSQYHWRGVICDTCNKHGWHGARYKCAHCSDYDLCGTCHDLPREVIQHDKEHVFHKVYHPTQLWRGVVCDGCEKRSFSGLRYKCRDCDDYGKPSKPHFSVNEYKLTCPDRLVRNVL